MFEGIGELVAHVYRETTDSRAMVVLPDKFTDAGYWEGKYGPDWADAHYRMADAHIAINVGWEWDLDHLNWFEFKDEYLEEFENDHFLEEIE